MTAVDVDEEEHFGGAMDAAMSAAVAVLKAKLRPMVEKKGWPWMPVELAIDEEVGQLEAALRQQLSFQVAEGQKSAAERLGCFWGVSIEHDNNVC